MSAQSTPVEAKLNYIFGNPALLQQALTHRSFSQTHNETLEFLGDAVLGAAIAKFLYLKFADAKEGQLSRLRAALVSGDALANLARDIKLGEHLRMGGGELASGGRNRRSLLSNAVEAVIGAVFLDGGYSAAEAVVAHLFQHAIDNLRLEHTKDAKTHLQELLQAKSKPLPQYVVVNTEGEQHMQVFNVRCSALEYHTLGSAKSRRAAEQDAAKNMLELLSDIEE